MAKKERLVIKISGMSCTSCAASLEKALNSTVGVLEASVNFAAEKASLYIDKDKKDYEQVLKVIEGAGFKGTIENLNIAERIFRIEGMSCANCALTIEKRLNNTDGVIRAAVNFGSEKLKISFDQEKLSVEQISDIVTDAGYKAILQDDEIVSSDSKKQSSDELLVRQMRSRMIKSAVLAGLIMALMIIRMSIGLIPPTFYRAITVLLAFPVVFVLGFRVHRSSWNSVKKGAANMDVLVSLGSMPPYLIGLLGFFYQMQTFVEMAAAIMTFHLIGKYLEVKAKGRASNAIKKLINLGAKTARIEKNINQGEDANRNVETIEIPVSDLKTGDVMVIKPGEKIPTDGVILEGMTNIDESMVSGESIPIAKKTGDQVIGATINQLGFIKARVTKTGRDTFLAQVIKLVEECQGSKVPIQEFADKVTGYFVPGIIVITVLTFISYLIFPDFHRAIISWGAGFLPWVNPDLPSLSLAFLSATAVLVISCPCALGLGTPTALMVGSGIGAERGILIRNGEAVQTLKDIDIIAFDKTGTITKGRPEVVDIVTLGDTSNEKLLYYASTLESVSEHPLAQSVLEKGKEFSQKLGRLTDSEVIPGKGVKGLVDGTKTIIGSGKLFPTDNLSQLFDGKNEQLESQAKTVIYISVDDKIIGLLAIADSIKEDSLKAISDLKKMGIKTVMITGDNQKTAAAIAKQVGINEVVSQVLPGEKVDAVKKLQQNSKQVAMVGDGINDAPSLKQANVGIAVGSGTDIAIEAADVTLVNDKLSGVVTAIRLSRATFVKIKENFFWAWFYNAVAIPVAIIGLLHPMIGAAAMSFSSLNVVYNSLRLKKKKI